MYYIVRGEPDNPMITMDLAVEFNHYLSADVHGSTSVWVNDHSSVQGEANATTEIVHIMSMNV